MKQSHKLVLSIIICELVGIAATPFTVAAIPTWYATLTKPSFSPPNWIFGPVWTILYFLMGISLYLVWKENRNKKKRTRAITYFAIQLFLNFVWSILFFGLRSPILGLIDILMMLTFIVLTIQHFIEISRTASILLLPYLAWVSFATLLNTAIAVLNP
jgi:translocator protein